MSRASALLSGLTALVLVLLLGNPPVAELIREDVLDQGNGFGLTARSAFFLSWDVFTRPFGDFGPATFARLLLFVVLAAVLGGVAGRSTKGAALIGGWGAGMAAAIVGSIGSTLLLDRRYVIGTTPDPSSTDQISLGAIDGAISGVLPAMLIAVAVAIGAKLPTASAPATTPGGPTFGSPPLRAAAPGGPPSGGAPPVTSAPGAPGPGAQAPIAPVPPDEGDATRPLPPA